MTEEQKTLSLKEAFSILRESGNGDRERRNEAAAVVLAECQRLSYGLVRTYNKPYQVGAFDEIAADVCNQIMHKLSQGTEVNRPHGYVARSLRNHAQNFFFRRRDRNFSELGGDNVSMSWGEHGSWENFIGGLRQAGNVTSFPEDVTLLVMFTDQEEAILRDAIAKLQERYPNTNYIPVMEEYYLGSGPGYIGRISEDCDMPIGTVKRVRSQGSDRLKRILKEEALHAEKREHVENILDKLEQIESSYHAKNDIARSA